MRMDKLTSQFQSALADAQSMAVGRDHAQIAPAHVMLALLEQEHGSTRPLINRLGSSVKQLQTELERQLKDLPTIGTATGDVGLSTDTGKLLNLADKEAQKRNDQYISS